MIRVTYNHVKYIDLDLQEVNIERIRQLLDNLHGPESCSILSTMRIKDDRDNNGKERGGAA